MGQVINRRCTSAFFVFGAFINLFAYMSFAPIAVAAIFFAVTYALLLLPKV
jgi:hypothetical protein